MLAIVPLLCRGRHRCSEGRSLNIMITIVTVASLHQQQLTWLYTDLTCHIDPSIIWNSLESRCERQHACVRHTIVVLKKLVRGRNRGAFNFGWIFSYSACFREPVCVQVDYIGIGLNATGGALLTFYFCGGNSFYALLGDRGRFLYELGNFVMGFLVCVSCGVAKLFFLRPYSCVQVN